MRAVSAREPRPTWDRYPAQAVASRRSGESAPPTSRARSAKRREPRRVAHRKSFPLDADGRSRTAASRWKRRGEQRTPAATCRSAPTSRRFLPSLYALGASLQNGAALRAPQCVLGRTVTEDAWPLSCLAEHWSVNSQWPLRTACQDRGATNDNEETKEGPGSASSAGALMEITTESSGFSSAPVDGAKLEVPAGFKEVEPEMGRRGRR